MDRGAGVDGAASAVSDRIELPGESPKTGFVSLYHPVTTLETLWLRARFVVAPGEDPCQTTYANGCRVRTCPRIDGDVADVPFTLTSAGKLTATVSGGISPVTMSIAPGPSDDYPMTTFEPTEARPNTGLEEVRFEAEGGKLPRFDATLPVPLVLLLGEPKAPPGASGRAVEIHVSRGEDLTLIWNRGEPDIELWVDGWQSAPDQATESVVNCRFPSVAGRATVPKAMWSVLPSGNPVDLHTVRLRTVSHGDFTTTLAAATEVWTADKAYRVTLVVD